MNVAVICEFSGIVRNAFKALGHHAVSFDLLDTELPGEHIKGDFRDMPYWYWDKFDLAICHPPCTYLSYAGIRHWNNIGRQEKREAAAQLFYDLVNLPIEKICIENPIGYMNTIYRKPDQIIQPYHYGNPDYKTTCLWLKNLPLLVPMKILDKPKPYSIDSTGKKRYFTDSCNSKNRSHDRSRTFPGIADAMAKQWGSMKNQQLCLF